MAFTLIIGPMKSGKSLELIARVAPYKFAHKKVLFLQPIINVRDTEIHSRNGVEEKGFKFKSLKDVKYDFDVIGIDEAHMFKEPDYKVVDDWLKAGKEVFVSGLDLDYRGNLIPIIKRFLELKPETVINKAAVCEVCKSYSAYYTQIMDKGKPIIEGLPLIVIDDGTYAYQPRCRNCFVKSHK